ncbi:MAG: T9SS type A sorting domain-containing protein [Ignavibacteria bacterium]
MKLNYWFIFFVLFAAVVFSPQEKVQAQSDTLIVEWWDGANLIPNALRTAIINDTNRTAGRVYKLRRGGYYFNDETIENVGWHLRIVGEDPNPNDPTGHPPVIQQIAREDGTLNGRMLTGNGSITFKNLYIIGCDDGGAQGSLYQPIQIDASNSRFVIDNCIFERNNFSIIAWTGKNNDIFVTNNIYRNLVEYPPTQLWTGRGLSFWADQDTVIVENNTFFNIAFTALQIESGIANYLRFNHNTLVNIGRAINTTPWLYEAYFANNLIINGYWVGESFNRDELLSPNRDPRAYNSGIFGFTSLPSKYGPELGRKILFTHAAAWLDPKFTAWQADSLRGQPFIGPVVRQDFVDPYEGIVVRDTTWLSEKPDFPTYPTDDIFDNMTNYIEEVRASQYFGGPTPSTTYFWMYPVDGGDTLFSAPSWPGNTPRGVPENFSYTTAGLLAAGTDGLALGDLNWFPDQKNTFEANKEQYVADIEELVQGIDVSVLGKLEAESTTLGGTAVIEDYAGELPYFRMEGGGFIEWRFNMAEAATVDLVIKTRSQDAVRGQHIRVNKTEGTGLRNNSGYGEYYWDDLDPVIWKAYTITAANLIENAADLDLHAGENFIRIAPSWGYQQFLSIDVVVGGNTIISLNASNVTTYDIVTLVSPDPSIYVPSGFKSVNMGATGTLTFPFDASAAGGYGITIFYQTPNGAQSGQLTAGTQTIDLSFEGESGNSDGRNLFSGVFQLAAGSNSLTLSAGNLLIDWIQFNSVISGITERPEIPNEFSLSQNYPNPFNPTTNINFSISKPSMVKLFIYDILGRKVATLINNQMNTGSYIYNFDASSFASGVYFYSLEAGDFKVTKKMMLLK